jgi:hypothetical protein
MNKEIITINNIPEVIPWWNMQYNLDDKTILHYIEINSWEDDDDENIIPESIELSFTFYDCQYFATISWEDLLINSNNICAEGPSILFSSFEDNIEENHWYLIVKLIKKLVNEQSN